MYFSGNYLLLQSKSIMIRGALQIWEGKTNMITFYWYPKCSTCKKAKQWLDENDVAYNQVDMIETPPKKRGITKMV